MRAVIQRVSQAARASSGWVFEKLASPGLVYLAIAVYIVTGIGFAVLIQWGHPFETALGAIAIGSHTPVPDEHRHIAAILMYADRGWWLGPVLTELAPEELVKGELTRNPSYLYHYVLSILLSGFRLITLEYDATVIFLRIVTLLIGAAGLYVVWRMLSVIGFGPRTAGFATVALSLTGRYVWQGAAVNYDVPATVLFFLFLYAAARVIRDRSPLQLVLAALWAALASITKYTYLPFAGLGLVLLIVIYVRALRANGERLGEQWRAQLRAAPVRMWSALGALAVATVLFVERIGTNLVVYRAVEPSCAAVFDAEACQQFAIYRRNENARAQYLEAIANGHPPAQYEPFQYTGDWLHRYYTSLYFYMGRETTWQVHQFVYVLLAIVLAVLIVMLAANRTKLVFSPGVAFVGAVSAVYVVGTYLLNLNTYLRYEQYFAHQGRYLLVVLPILYALLVRLAWNNWLAIPGLAGRILRPSLVVVGALAFVVHTALVAFAPYTGAQFWFSDYGEALRDWLKAL